MSDEVDYALAAALLGVARHVLPTTELVTVVPPPKARIAFEPLSDIEWDAVRIALPPLPVPRPGGFRDREFIDAVLWHRCAQDCGFGWSALPEHFPPRATMQHRWHRWAVAGSWQLVSDRLIAEENLTTDRKIAFCRIARDAEQRRKRILSNRRRLNESI